jgi:acetyl esterase
MSDLPVRVRLENTFLRALMAMPDPVLRRLAGRPIAVDGQRLEADAQLLLRLRNLSPNKPYDELPVADARRTLEEDSAGVRGGLVPVAEVRDLEVGGLPARLYVPEVEAGGMLV